MCNSLKSLCLISTLVLIGCAENPSSAGGGFAGNKVGHFGYGQPATQEQIAGWDIDIRPDGLGYPQGSGSVEDGEMMYETQCAECHGSFGEGVGRYPVLAGGMGTLTEERPERTVGSYWPYASTLFDYIRRAMPFTQPESLSDDETYAITAYVLYLNELVEDDFVADKASLSALRMPNEQGFFRDDRPDTANTRCMSDCLDPASLTVHSEVAGVVIEEQTTAAEKQTSAHPGAQTYEQFCSICHKVGVGGAPVVGDAAAWEPRIASGVQALIDNAINGVSSDSGVMPPKGGFAQLSDEAVADAVRYMAEESR